MISVGLALPTLLASPVSAKAMPEFIVSGGDLEHPIYVSADEVIGVVQGSDHGWVMGGEAAAPQRLGKNYDLDLLQFQFPGESFPSQRRIEARWAYHPEASGAMTAEDEWVPFSPKLNGLLLARISDQPQPARPDGDVLPLAALGAACLSAG